MNIFEQLNKIDDNESLSEKYNVKNAKELRKLKEGSACRNHKLDSYGRKLDSINEAYFTKYSYDEWIQGLEAAHDIYAEFGEDIYKQPLWSKIMELSACENLYKDLVEYMDAWIAHKGSKNFPHKSYAKHLEEAAFSGGVAGDNSASGGTVRGRGGSTQSSKDNYLTRLTNNNSKLQIINIKGKELKPNMFTQIGQIKTAKVMNAPYYGKDMMYVMHTNNYDTFYDPDKEVEVLADPNNKSKPFEGTTKELSDMGVTGIY